MFNSFSTIICNIIMLILCNLAGFMLNKKDDDIVTAMSEKRKNGIALIIELNIACVVCALICDPILVSVICITGLQAYSDELTMQVYSTPETLMSVGTLAALFICTPAINTHQITDIVICVTLLIILKITKAVGDGDIECVLPFIFALAASEYDVIYGTFGMLAIACWYTIIKDCFKKIAEKKVPLDTSSVNAKSKKIPFVKGLFVGMVIVSLVFCVM